MVRLQQDDKKRIYEEIQQKGGNSEQLKNRWLMETFGTLTPSMAVVNQDKKRRIESICASPDNKPCSSSDDFAFAFIFISQLKKYGKR